MGIGIAGWSFLFLITLFIPYIGVKKALAAKKPVDPRYTLAVFVQSAISSQVLGLGIALIVALQERALLFPPPHFTWLMPGLAAAFLAINLGTLPTRWSWRSLEEKKRSLWRIPAKPADLWPWALVSLGAGFTEEIIYRGVLFQLWERPLGVAGSIAVCSLAFAFAHGYQGWRSIAVIIPMAVANHLIVLWTGDLYTAMIIHAVYDFLAGIMLMRLVARDGLVGEGVKG